MGATASPQEQPGASASQPSPSDTSRPKAFFNVTLGGKKSGKAKDAEKDAEDAGAKGAGAAKSAKAKAKAQALVMTAAEAGSIREALIDMLMDLWPKVDSGLTFSSADKAEAYIWASLDRDDTAFIVDYILARAQQSAAVAEQVRIAQRRFEQWRLLAILGPRLGQTAQWYPEHGLDLLGLHMEPATERKAKRQAERQRRTAQ